MSTETPSSADYAFAPSPRRSTNPRATGYRWPAEDPRYTGPDIDNSPRTPAAVAEHERATARTNAALDRGIARSLAALTPEQRETVLAGQPPQRRAALEALIAAVDERRSA